MSSSLALDPRRPLTSTYRLQMNAGFTLDHARARLDYFEQLGVSHLYLSPILCARRGSQHGYDVVDPARINPELGNEAGLRALAGDLHARSMGLIVDIVPNHMAIGEENRYWDDVLTHGERSRYARWFDIDWSWPPEPSSRGRVAPEGSAFSSRRKLILPILGNDLDRVLERGELSVRLHEGETPRITYASQSFPIDPDSLPPDLQLAQVDPEETGELAKRYSGIAGRDRLRKLLEAQHYRLVSWRRGRTAINYRRFFDVNELAAVRVEDPAVFGETHALVVRLVRDGVIDGLRIDHVDGLLDPAAYLERLRAATSPETAIFVEKILAPDECLPDTWPVQGTTGYEFLNDVENAFLDPVGTPQVERFYRRLRRLGSTTFADIARDAKTCVLAESLRADVDRVAMLLLTIAKEANREWNADEIAAALIAFIAAMPVYRTYIDATSPLTPADRAVVQCTAAAAIRHGGNDDIIGFIAGLLCDESLSGDAAATRVRFAQRVQQLSGPAAARGVEDTALYVYVPVISRDEVGSEPDQPVGGAVDRLHRANARRAERWPASLVATNTHDAKRSADVRSRLDALTEIPHEWERAVRRWRKLNGKHRKVVKGRLSPDTNTEYLMYQIAVALWPPPRAGRRRDDLPERAWRESARDRLSAYALKAAREAKTRTSWVDPDADYERALADFIAAILEPSADAPFLADVARLVSRVAAPGAWNALSRLVVHLTSPGTPDIYQGDELWNFALVDPDNRRLVDYDVRQAALSELPKWELQERPGDPFDHRLKLSVTRRLLCLRRSLPRLFALGGYERLSVRGPRANHVIAFARTFENRRTITLASRLLGEQTSAVDAEWWRNTAVEMTDNYGREAWTSALTDAQVATNDDSIAIAAALGKLPAVVLVN